MRHVSEGLIDDPPVLGLTLRAHARLLQVAATHSLAERVLPVSLMVFIEASGAPPQAPNCLR